jgi:hypothetical protein
MSQVITATLPKNKFIQTVNPGEQIMNTFAITLRSFGLNHHVDLLVEANVSEKSAISIFRAEVMSRNCKGPYIYSIVGEEISGEGVNWDE